MFQFHRIKSKTSARPTHNGENDGKVEAVSTPDSKADTKAGSVSSLDPKTDHKSEVAPSPSLAVSKELTACRNGSESPLVSKDKKDGQSTAFPSGPQSD
ncbi:hypothetical protein CFP56_008962 [Quercus suber]|uniref:Uncharacterized protein n=1 Tax=Quercus suber TaxID=58331 RepID=A0AAW0L4G2_QUESU|nr:hypothetical protein CFP56_28192 [Quercus suber]